MAAGLDGYEGFPVDAAVGVHHTSGAPASPDQDAVAACSISSL